MRHLAKHNFRLMAFTPNGLRAYFQPYLFRRKPWGLEMVPQYSCFELTWEEVIRIGIVPEAPVTYTRVLLDGSRAGIARYLGNIFIDEKLKLFSVIHKNTRPTMTSTDLDNILEELTNHTARNLKDLVRAARALFRERVSDRSYKSFWNSVKEWFVEHNVKIVRDALDTVEALEAMRHCADFTPFVDTLLVRYVDSDSTPDKIERKRPLIAPTPFEYFIIGSEPLRDKHVVGNIDITISIEKRRCVILTKHNVCEVVDISQLDQRLIKLGITNGPAELDPPRIGFPRKHRSKESF